MPFFERGPVDDADDELQHDLPQPGRWLGGVVPIEAVVARTEDGAVAVRSVIAYPDGFRLEVVAWRRRTRRRRRSFGPDVLLNTHHLPPPGGGSGGGGDGGGGGGGTWPDDLVRFGVEFPDGGRATNLDDRWAAWPDATTPMHGMRSMSGSGGTGEFAQEFWVWPLPADGPVRFVCEWPATGIDETALEVDGALFVDAAARARPVWPDELPFSHLPGS